MNNLYVNIRFGAYHFQIGRVWPWITIGDNEYHDKKNRQQNFKWFEIYDFPMLNKFLNH